MNLVGCWRKRESKELRLTLYTRLHVKVSGLRSSVFGPHTTVDFRCSLARLFFLVAIGMTAMASLGCTGRSGPDPTLIRNVVLISIDTCRPDHLSCYGIHRATTPNIDAVAAEGVLFENVISPVPLTLPAHCSMHTGTNPPTHGVHDNNDYQLAPHNVTLAEILKDRGLATGAVIGAFVLNAQFGMDQGFAAYHDQFDDSMNTVGVAERRADEVSRYANQFLTEHRDEPFFLFVHYYDPHNSYAPPEPYASKFADDPYTGEIAYTDHCIGQVIDHLKKLQLDDKTLVIITTDHGEMLGEHGERTHGYFIYQSAVRVALIVRSPGLKPRRVENLAGLIDIVPTVCGLLNIDIPEHVQGVDLSPSFSGKPLSDANRYLYCESLFATKYAANPLLGLVGRDWKFIQTTRPELYDLSQDPEETRNVASENPSTAIELGDHLAMMTEEQHRDMADRSKTMDSEAVRKLESLGYVGGSSVEEGFEFDRTKDDPKDLIDFHRMRLNLVYLLHTKQFVEARELCLKMVEQRPQYALGHYDLGVLAMELEQHATAEPHFRRVIELKPDYAEAHNNLAILLMSQGKGEQAKAHYERALQADPDYAEAHNNLGRLLEAQGKRDDAIRHYEQALRSMPDFAEAHINLADCLLDLGKAREAVNHLRQALRLNDNDSRAHKALASVLLKQGQLNEAIGHWGQALRINPHDVQAHVDLGNALQQQNRLDEAISHYQQVLKVDPDSVEAHNNLGNALQLAGRLDKAIGHYQHVLRIKRDFVEAHYNLALALSATRRYDDALKHVAFALQHKPDWIPAMIKQAWILAAHPEADMRQPQEALRMAQRAVALAGSPEVSTLDTLAVAYAAAGQFDLAITVAQQALDLATAAQARRLSQDIRQRLQLYQVQQPFQLPSRDPQRSHTQ